MLETDICAPKIIVYISVIDYLKHILKKSILEERLNLNNYSEMEKMEKWKKSRKYTADYVFEKVRWIALDLSSPFPDSLQ